MNPQISIIVPVYNTGKILIDTMDSILKQTFTDFELILVDDGSKDVSSDICDEYEKKDNRIRVIHQENKGICAARNMGISVAKGKYITFCDHDDIYMPQKLQIQYELAEATNADVVNVGYKTIFDSGQYNKYAVNLECLNREKIKENIFELCYHCLSTIWVKLYRVSTLQKYLIFNTIYTRGYEDVNFNINIIKHVSSFVSTDKVLYHHLVRKDLSTSSHVYKQTVIGMKDLILNYKYCIETYGIDLNSNKKEYSWVLSQQLRTIAVYMRKTNISYNEYVDTLESLYFTIVRMPLKDYFIFNKIPYKDRLVLYLIQHKKYKLLWKICRVSLF